MSDKRLKLLPHQAQFILRWTYQGQQCRNIFYNERRVADVPTPWDDSTATDYAANLFNAYTTAYMLLTADVASLDGIDWVWNENLDTGPLHEGTDTISSYPVIGSEASDGAAANVSLAIKLGTGLGGRNFHGRFYFVGVNAGLYDFDTPSQLKAGSVGDFASANNLFVSTANQGLVGPPSESRNLSVASFILGGAARAAAVLTPVIAASLVDTVFDSQRRRLPGRGS